MALVATLFIVTNTVSVPQLDLNTFGSPKSLIQAFRKAKSVKTFSMTSISFGTSSDGVHTEQ